jgi:hypothetical protein
MNAASKAIQKAIKHPGRVLKYIRREYGIKAFTKSGKILPKYLDMAIAKVKAEHNVSLERALVQAKNLKALAMRRMRG